MRAFVHALEDWLIATLARLGVEGERREGQIGVFVGEAKIASIGIRVRHWVSFHGVSLNVDPDLDAFRRHRALRADDTPVTSLAALGIDADMQRVDAALRSAFEEMLRSQLSANWCRCTLKPGATEPPSLVTVTLVTRASGGPSAQSRSISSTLSAGPENTASTLPSLALRTVPSRPSARAVCSVQAR